MFKALREKAPGKLVEALEIISDPVAPGLIADAAFLGHLAIRNFETDPREIATTIYRRQIPSLQEPTLK